MFETVIQFTDMSSFADSWIWNFDDGTTSTDQNPSHQFSDLKEFCVTLIAKGAGDCSDSVRLCLPFDPEGMIFIPDSFTPHKDPRNPIIEIRGGRASIRDFHLLIFDRWGGKVFESESIDKGWNGLLMNTGEQVQQGVYAYRLQITFAGGKEYQYLGMVNLIR
jgi:gliding motility-associated-like protein